MASIRTNRKFAELDDTDLSRFFGKVIAGCTAERDVLTDLPVPVEAMTELKTRFDAAVVKADKGGSLATARKNAVRAEVLDALHKNASYVDIKCDGDRTILIGSGFEEVSTNRAQSPLEKPQITAVQTPGSGQLKIRVKADRNTKSFLGHIKETTGSEFGPSISFPSSRKIIFDGLKAGVTYVFELMAVGGSTGQSDWSDPGTGMAR